MKRFEVMKVSDRQDDRINKGNVISKLWKYVSKATLKTVSTLYKYTEQEVFWE